MKNYAKIVEPHSDANNVWQTVKEMLKKTVILVHPDTSKQYTLISDASSISIVGIFTQIGDDGHLHPVSYGLSILTDAQRLGLQFSETFIY